jgi:hypothetical protein
LEVQEGYGAILKLRAHDALGDKAQPITIEGQRPVEVVYTQRD